MATAKLQPFAMGFEVLGLRFWLPSSMSCSSWRCFLGSPEG